MTNSNEMGSGRAGNTIGVFLNCTANESSQEIEKSLRAKLEFDLGEAVSRYQEMRGSTVIFPDKHFSHCLLEIQDAYVCGHFFSVVSGCQSLVEAMMRDWAVSIGGKWGDAFVDKVDQLEKRTSSFPKQLFADVKRIYDDRNDFHHLNPSVPLEHQKLKEMAKEKIGLLLGCMKILYAYDTKDGVLIPKTELWHTKKPTR